jgi:hypothetical protein
MDVELSMSATCRHQAASTAWMSMWVLVTDGAGSHAGVSQPPERGWRDIYGATISFGPVVFQVFGTRVAALLDGSLILNPHRLFFRCGRIARRSPGRRHPDLMITG